MKKLPLTLIEVCIALGLAALVISFLFSSLLQTVQMSKTLAAAKERSLETSLFYSRLLNIFSHADPSLFEFEEDQVIFYFENGLDPELIFSGMTKATLRFSDMLSLDTSSKDGTSIRKEILLTNIEELAWESNLPFFLTLHLKRPNCEKREFVFFFSDRPEKSEPYLI